MATIVECRTGTGQLAALFADLKKPITGVKLVGDDPPEADVKVLLNHESNIGHYISVLILETTKKDATLQDTECLRITKLLTLRELSLHGFQISAGNLAQFTALTHLTLDSASDEQIGAINKLPKLTHLTLGSSLGHFQINSLFGLKSLTDLQAPFQFDKPVRGALQVATNLPKLQRVTTLPLSSPLTPEIMQELVRTFQFQPTSFKKRLFTLVDSHGHDLFHYCREALVCRDEATFEWLLRHVDKDTASPEQLLAWLDYSLDDAERAIFEKVLLSNVDVNLPLPGKELALVVAVSGCIARSEKVYEVFVDRLLQHGANPEKCDGFGHSAIVVATKHYRSELVKKLLGARHEFSQDCLNDLLVRAIGLGIKHGADQPANCKSARAFSIARAIIKKHPAVHVVTTQLERILKCDVPVPVEVVAALVQAGAKTDVKNETGKNALQELLATIDALYKENSTDTVLVELKFEYFKALKGEERMKSFTLITKIATHFKLWGMVDFLKSKQAGKRIIT